MTSAAEGVETTAKADILRNPRCAAEGFLFARPAQPFDVGPLIGACGRHTGVTWLGRSAS